MMSPRPSNTFAGTMLQLTLLCGVGLLGAVGGSCSGKPAKGSVA